jgi:hypothetical protein
MTSYRRARKRCRFTDRAKQRRRLSAGSGEKGPTESINLEIKDLESVTEQNPLDFFDVSSLNGRDLPTRPPDSGWFSDDLSFNSQALLPHDGKSCRSNFGGSSQAVPASFPQFLCTKSVRVVPREDPGMPPTRTERFSRQSVVKLLGPRQSGEQCCKKRYLHQL